MSKKDVVVHCETCNKSFVLREAAVQEVKVKKNFKEYLLTFYKCPMCSVFYVVMVRDEQALKTQEEYMQLVNKINLCMQRNQRPSITLIKKSVEMQNKFKRETKKLGFEFPKTFYQFDELKLDNPHKIVTGRKPEEEETVC